MIDINTTITPTTVIGGFTTPTYVLTSDSPPMPNMRQSIVTALGGTQTGVRTHSPSDPFTITSSKPQYAVPYPKVALNGVLGKAGRNKMILSCRKGTIPLVGQAPQISDVQIISNIVSGAEVNDVANVAALWQCVISLAHREIANLLVGSKTGSN